MKVVLTTVSEASVAIKEKTVGKIGRGYLLLVGFTDGD
ncbi:MAG: D-aminoacyl-tRNA deacylase, partial [Bacilli bacterium]|nr:D-aminoacyl-tRNA deacylase [Bacilli bacterium]